MPSAAPSPAVSVRAPLVAAIEAPAVSQTRQPPAADNARARDECAAADDDAAPPVVSVLVISPATNAAAPPTTEVPESTATSCRPWCPLDVPPVEITTQAVSVVGAAPVPGVSAPLVPSVLPAFEGAAPLVADVSAPWRERDCENY